MEMKLLFVLSILLLPTLYSTSAKHKESKAGIYRTQKDFENRNLEKMDKFVTLRTTGYNVKLTFKKNGEKIEFTKKDFYAYQDNDGIINRITYRKGRLVLVALHVIGKLCFYTDSGHHEWSILLKNTLIIYVTKDTYFFISEGETGKIQYVTQKDIRARFRNDPEMLKYFRKKNMAATIQHYNEQHPTPNQFPKPGTSIKFFLRAIHTY